MDPVPDRSRAPGCALLLVTVIRRSTAGVSSRLAIARKVELPLGRRLGALPIRARAFGVSSSAG